MILLRRLLVGYHTDKMNFLIIYLTAGTGSLVLLVVLMLWDNIMFVILFLYLLLRYFFDLPGWLDGNILPIFLYLVIGWLVNRFAVNFLAINVYNYRD